MVIRDSFFLLPYADDILVVHQNCCYSLFTSGDLLLTSITYYYADSSGLCYWIHFHRKMTFWERKLDEFVFDLDPTVKTLSTLWVLHVISCCGTGGINKYEHYFEQSLIFYYYHLLSFSFVVYFRLVLFQFPKIYQMALTIYKFTTFEFI